MAYPVTDSRLTAQDIWISVSTIYPIYLFNEHGFTDGQSQKASMDTAGAALATMLILAPLLGLLPHAVLAAVVIVYSIGLIQPAEFVAIRKERLLFNARATIRHYQTSYAGQDPRLPPENR